MLGERRRKVVEVIGQLDLAAQRSECLCGRTASLHCDQSGDGTSGTLNDDLLAALGKVYQPRQLALGLMHPDAHHDHTITLS